MKYCLYSIKDLKSGYLPVQVDINDDTAVRNFEHAVGIADSIFFSHPADYELYKVGEYDTDNGEIEPIEKKFIIDANSIVNRLKK